MEKTLAKFDCKNCGKEVEVGGKIGTHQRNHCPFCLCSRHVDDARAGDRRSDCRGIMKPVALTFREEGMDKYGRKRQGEIMIVHKCVGCDKICLNRIAGDDNPDEILKIYKNSLKYNDHLDFKILTEEDLPELKKQLFGISE